MLLTVLSVASSFAPVSPDAAGDAEQILSRIDRALTAAGHKSIVVACAGSRTAGELFPFPLPEGQDLRERDIREENRLCLAAGARAAIDRALAANRVDLVHLHGVDLDSCRLPDHLPVLISLHGPAAQYRPAPRSSDSGRVRYCCASEWERRSLPAEVGECVVIENGVPMPEIDPRWPKGDFALTLGPLGRENNPHQAIEAGSRAGVRVLLSGEIYPQHRRYFREQIEPGLRLIPRGRPQHAFLGRLPEQHRQALLSRAQCLLHPTLAPETGLLAVLEALAAGTPVIAYHSAALAGIVNDGVTGFLVDSVAEMAAALARVHTLSPQACREAARRRCPAESMIGRYFELYETMAHRQPVEALCA